MMHETYGSNRWQAELPASTSVGSVSTVEWIVSATFPFQELSFMRKTAILWILLISPLWAAQGTHRRNTLVGASAHLPPAAIAAMQKIDPERIRAHVKFLSSDLLE